MELIYKVAVVLIVGFIGGRLARKLKLPDVSGYLILGLVLGPSMGLIFTNYGGFITAEDQTTLKFISELALAFIAFSIGSEFNFSNLRKYGKSINTITAFEVVGAVMTVFLVLFFIPKPEPIMVGGYNPFSKGNIAFGLILASMSAATAPAATLMVMRQYRAYGPVTKTVLPVTALDDIYGIVVFGFAISIAQMLVNPSDMHIALMIAKPFIEVFGSIIIGVVLGYILARLANFMDKSRDDLQVLSIATVLLSIGIIFLINKAFEQYAISLSTLLACIAVGTMVANFTKKPVETFTSINDFTTPFYVLFFTLAGASLDLGILGTSALVAVLAVAYIIARGTGKYLGASINVNIRMNNCVHLRFLSFS
ncbi:MAG: cation:proton antiporter [Acholeplasmatales bacterium]